MFLFILMIIIGIVMIIPALTKTENDNNKEQVETSEKEIKINEPQLSNKKQSIHKSKAGQQKGKKDFRNKSAINKNINILKVGNKIIHKHFGEGVILSINKKVIEIEFNEFGYKKFDLDFCKRNKLFVSTIKKTKKKSNLIPEKDFTNKNTKTTKTSKKAEPKANKNISYKKVNRQYYRVTDKDIGRRIFHNNFGYGVIYSFDDRYLKIEFDSKGIVEFPIDIFKKSELIRFANKDEAVERKTKPISNTDFSKDISSIQKEKLDHDYQTDFNWMNRLNDISKNHGTEKIN